MHLKLAIFTSWTVSFEKPVTVESYIISGDTEWIWWITSWEISYSMNGESFTPIQTDKINERKHKKVSFCFSCLLQAIEDCHEEHF